MINPKANSKSVATGRQRSWRHLASCSIVLVGLVFALPCNDTWAANNYLFQIQQDYNAGKYSDALAILARLRPSAISHYYSGLCYQGLNQVQLAKEEFGLVLSESKNRRLRYNSEAALSYLNRYQATRTYKGQGNNFFKPVQSPVAAAVGSPSLRSYNPTVSRSDNPYFNPTYSPAILRGNSPGVSQSERNDQPSFNPTYSSTVSRSDNPYF
jgi:hypothetical protein